MVGKVKQKIKMCGSQCTQETIEKQASPHIGIAIEQFYLMCFNNINVSVWNYANETIHINMVV